MHGNSTSQQLQANARHALITSIVVTTALMQSDRFMALFSAASMDARLSASALVERHVLKALHRLTDLHTSAAISSLHALCMPATLCLPVQHAPQHCYCHHVWRVTCMSQSLVKEKSLTNDQNLIKGRFVCHSRSSTCFSMLFSSMRTGGQVLGGHVPQPPTPCSCASTRRPTALPYTSKCPASFCQPWCPAGRAPA